MELRTFFVVLLSFTGAVGAIIGAIVLAIGHVRRLASTAPGQLSAEELDAMRERLAELEQRDLRVEELAERLDFVERVLGRSREAKSLRDPTESP